MRLRMPAMRPAAAIVLLTLTTARGAAAQQAAPAAPPAAPAAAPLAEVLTGAARADYELGKSLFGNGDFANAFTKFEHAYALSKDVRLLWNMAVCKNRMHRYSHVLTLVERLRREDRGALTPQDWATIDALERGARSLVGHLDIAVSEAGAEVTIDDAPAGKTPLSGKVIVDSGARRIRVDKPGFKAHVRVERVAPGAEVVVQIQLEPRVHAGKLSVSAPPGARIALDGALLGQGRWDGAVPSGRHALRVTAPGMMPYESELVIQDDELSRLSVGLTPVASGPRTWVWLTGGALVVAAGVVVGVLLLQPSPAPPIEGTLGPTRPTGFGGRW
ncbi:PEGA domain-containing protein [Sorangium sp. So ce1014]|uniref:PEGA domain-containing protein n=1 Tax=Sorangium sp. So ce1014 TaxID=3133326 RepID=UPI003F6433FA